MKKLFAILALFAVVLSLSACTTKVAGKTFTYEKFEYTVNEDLTALEKGAAELAATAIKAGAQIDITFNEDGTCTLGKYTQDGSKVIINENIEYKAVGGKLVLESEGEGFSYKVTYVEKK